MPDTARILEQAACLISLCGLHTGDQFAAPNPHGPLDACAAIYIAAEKPGATPAEFYTDEVTSLALIEASADAMQAIRALSDALDTEPPTTEIVPGMEVPDHIDHVSNWAATTPPFANRPPTETEVIGRLIRTAEALRTPNQPIPPQRTAGTTPGNTDAWGHCLTCLGHGAITGAEIPYEELRPRQQQGYDHGRRYHRSEPCPHCDGQDRVTDEAVSAHEASL